MARRPTRWDTATAITPGFAFNDFGGDLAQHVDGARMALVVEFGHAASVVVIANDASEHHDGSRRRVRYGTLMGVGIERFVADRDDRDARRGRCRHGVSPANSGSGTSGTTSPATASVPGAMTAKPTAWASPRSIDDATWLTGWASPVSSRRTRAR